VPNQFEAELLSGMKITDEISAFEAMARLHEIGVNVVVLSSSDSNANSDKASLKCLASRKIFKSERCDDANSPEKDTKLERFRITFPKLPLPFVGSGDLFTALLTAWLTRSCNNSWQNNLDIAIALEKTVATMEAVLGRTLEHYNRNVKSNPQGLQIAALKELKLIQSRDDILNPKILQKAERVEL
jgi:pyridoxine kinase